MNNVSTELKSPYLKLTKNALIEKLEAADQVIALNAGKIANYDKMKSKYDIIKGARQEDLETVRLANETIKIHQQKEQEMILTFRTQLGELQGNIAEQNQTILTLFEMMDNSINQQIFYYTKFKSIFVNMNPPQPAEEVPQPPAE